MSEKIYRLLFDNDMKNVELDHPYESTFGNITRVGRSDFRTEDGETYDLSELEDYDLANLLYDMELQIEANEKTFLKATDF